ncbi:MAG TPA: hypothetical protein VGF45_24690, partial [Polyangia bacterium]
FPPVAPLNIRPRPPRQEAPSTPPFVAPELPVIAPLNIRPRPPVVATQPIPSGSNVRIEDLPRPPEKATYRPGEFVPQPPGTTVVPQDFIDTVERYEQQMIASRPSHRPPPYLDYINDPLRDEVSGLTVYDPENGFVSATPPFRVGQQLTIGDPGNPATLFDAVVTGQRPDGHFDVQWNEGSLVNTGILRRNGQIFVGPEPPASAGGNAFAPPVQTPPTPVVQTPPTPVVQTPPSPVVQTPPTPTVIVPNSPATPVNVPAPVPLPSTSSSAPPASFPGDWTEDVHAQVPIRLTNHLFNSPGTLIGGVVPISGPHRTFRATITGRQPDGTFSIRWDDGVRIQTGVLNQQGQVILTDGVPTVPAAPIESPPAPVVASGEGPSTISGSTTPQTPSTPVSPVFPLLDETASAEGGLQPNPLRPANDNGGDGDPEGPQAPAGANRPVATLTFAAHVSHQSPVRTIITRKTGHGFIRIQFHNPNDIPPEWRRQYRQHYALLMRDEYFVGKWERANPFGVRLGTHPGRLRHDPQFNTLTDPRRVPAASMTYDLTLDQVESILQYVERTDLSDFNACT